MRALVAALVAVAALGVAPTLVEASTRDRLAATRAAVDRAAVQYFDAQIEAVRIERELAAVEQRLERSGGRMAALRAEAGERAAQLYRSGGGAQLLAAYDTADVLDVARRTALIEQANARASASIDAYAAARDDLRRQRAELSAQRRAQQAVLADLESNQRELDAQLASLTRQLTSEQAAERAAAARSRSEAASPTGGGSGGSGDGGGGGATPTTRGGTATTVPTTGAPPTSTTVPTTGTTSPPNPGTHPHHNDPFLSCVRQRESRGIYTAVNPAGYYGAYQFAIRTWDATAAHAGRYELIGVRPDRAGVYDQDDMAWTLLNWYGTSPWGGRCP